MAADHVACELPPIARSVTEARRFVLAAVRRWGQEEIVDTVELLTSEVVTNAVLHARTPVDVVVRRLTNGVTVEVSDGSLQVPRQRQAGREATTGRGVRLIDELATAWEVKVHATGKTVTFTVTDARDPWSADSQSWMSDQ